MHGGDWTAENCAAVLDNPELQQAFEVAQMASAEATRLRMLGNQYAKGNKGGGGVLFLPNNNHNPTGKGGFQKGHVSEHKNKKLLMVNGKRTYV